MPQSFPSFPRAISLLLVKLPTWRKSRLECTRVTFLPPPRIERRPPPYNSIPPPADYPGVSPPPPLLQVFLSSTRFRRSPLLFFGCVPHAARFHGCSVLRFFSPVKADFGHAGKTSRLCLGPGRLLSHFFRVFFFSPWSLCGSEPL